MGTETPAAPSAEPSSRQLGELLLKLLAGAVSALGLAGFVAVLGGAVVWVRLHSAQLPADQAVAVIPKSQLIVTGAAPLVLFLLLGAVAVVGVYVTEPRGIASTRTASAIVVLVGVELCYAVVTGELLLGGTLALLAIIVANTVAAVLLLKRWRAACRERDALRTSPESGQEEARRLVRVVRDRQRDLATLAVWQLAIGVLLWWIVPWLGYTLLVASVLGVVLLGVAYSTDGFLPYGCAVFLSLALYGAAEKSLQSLYGTPRIQPAAALVEGYPEGISGLYIGETSERLYLARVRPCQEREPPGLRGALTGLVARERQWRASRGTGFMFWVPEDRVTALNLGSVQKLDKAMANRRRMRYLLLETVTGRRKPLPPVSTQGQPCPSS